MIKYIPILLVFSLSCAEKELPKPIMRPHEVIIYPPKTAEEFIERRRILREALTGPTITRIMIKDKRPSDTTTQ